MSVWFLSPAFERIKVSAIVYEHRAWMLKQLRRRNIDAEGLIVADDANLELARAAGMRTLEHPNLPLGRKLNAGFEYAVKNGADWVCFIGSDSLALPGAFRNLDRLGAGTPTAVIYGCWYTIMTGGAKEYVRERDAVRMVEAPPRLHVLHVPIPTWALNIYPRELLRSLGNRPVDDALNRGLDGSIRNRLGTYREAEVEVNEFQIVSLRSQPQITSDEALVRRYFKRHATLREMRKAGHPLATIRKIAELYGIEETT